MEDTIIANAETTNVEDVVVVPKKKSRSRKQKVTAVAETPVVVSNPTTAEDEIQAQSAEPESCDLDTLCVTGAKIEINKRFALFRTSVATRPMQYTKGKFYIYNEEIVTGRVRLTDSPSGVGKIDRCIGWANFADISAYIK